MTTHRQITMQAPTRARTRARTQVRAEAATVSEPPLRLILAAVALGMLVSTLFG